MVQLLLTRHCNLICRYCSSSQFDEKELEPELSTDEWLNVIYRLKDIQVFEVTFSGGEIFLRPDIFQILDVAVKCKFPKIVVTSNGTLIDDAVVKQLKSLCIKNVAISIDGDRESHDLLRGTGSFDKAIKGIEHLEKNGITPEILFTPLKSNYKTLAGTIETLYLLGIKKLSFNKLHPTGRCKTIYNDVMLDTFTDAPEFFEIIKNLREKFPGFKISDPPFTYHCYPQMYSHEGRDLSKKDKQRLKPCSAGHSSCNVTASGWVIPCSEFFNLRGGNIREQDILDIWCNSTNFEKIRELSNLPVDEIPYCRNCDYNIFCNAGCRADAYAIHGDLLAPDPFCPYYKTLER